VARATQRNLAADAAARPGDEYRLVFQITQNLPRSTQRILFNTTLRGTQRYAKENMSKEECILNFTGARIGFLCALCGSRFLLRSFAYLCVLCV
ncbi:MAG: hypothetical protein ACREB3_06470, partial [Burkholderiales bacterium]